MMRAAALLVSAALGGLLPCARASACSCNSQWAQVVWPVDGAQGMALDTTVVLRRHDVAGHPEGLVYSLLDADGNPIELKEVERLDQPSPGCGNAELVFLRAPAALRPATDYRFEVQVPEGPPDQELVVASFSTTAADSPPTVEVMVPEVQVELTYLELVRPECTERSCEALAHVRVELEGPPVSPMWFTLRSAAGGATGNARAPFWPLDWPHGSGPDLTAQLSVELSPNDRCIEARVVGFDGTTLFETERCTPDRCARYPNWTPNICTGPPGTAVAVERIDDGSCEDPPMLEVGAAGEVIYPDEVIHPDDAHTDGVDAGTPSPAAGRSGDGCSLSHGATPGAGWWPVALVFAALFVRRRRLARARA